MKKTVKRIRSYRCSDAMYLAVESAAGNMGMSMNEFVVDSLKRNLANPMYAVDKEKEVGVSRIDVLDELSRVSAALGEVVKAFSGIEKKYQIT